MNSYIKNSFLKSKSGISESLFFGNIPVIQLKALPKTVFLNKILSTIEKKLKSKNFILNLKGIYIGSFKELKERSLRALYKDNFIYVSDYRDISKYKISEEIIIKDIIHEIGHIVQQNFQEQIYSDNLLFDDFILKRKLLGRNLIANNFILPDSFLNSIDYSKIIDNFLVSKVGYPALTNFISNIFISPYSATSISEYFSCGFEEYFAGNNILLRQISPVLYTKIDTLRMSIGDI